MVKAERLIIAPVFRFSFLFISGADTCQFRGYWLGWICVLHHMIEAWSDLPDRKAPKSTAMAGTLILGSAVDAAFFGAMACFGFPNYGYIQVIGPCWV